MGLFTLVFFRGAMKITHLMSRELSLYCLGFQLLFFRSFFLLFARWQLLPGALSCVKSPAVSPSLRYFSVASIELWPPVETFDYPSDARL